MPWIRTNPEVTKSTVMAPLSINPGALQAVEMLNKNISFGSSALTRVQEEAIAVVVSMTNQCRY
jgi:alkylhydroperoxidase family enzyme